MSHTAYFTLLLNTFIQLPHVYHFSFFLSFFLSYFLLSCCLPYAVNPGGFTTWVSKKVSKKVRTWMQTEQVYFLTFLLCLSEAYDEAEAQK
jgi:hypothetical protein